MILKMTILINCTGKFCYWHGNFQNAEAAIVGVLKSFTKFTGKPLCQSIKLQAYFRGSLFREHKNKMILVMILPRKTADSVKVYESL